jgi:hypothetical protein
MAIDDSAGVLCIRRPRKLAAELLPLLKKKGESPDTLKALVAVTDRDFAHMAKRLGELLARRIVAERRKILVELERLLERKCRP